jgi:hypothetical protein
MGQQRNIHRGNEICEYILVTIPEAADLAADGMVTTKYI